MAPGGTFVYDYVEVVGAEGTGSGSGEGYSDFDGGSIGDDSHGVAVILVHALRTVGEGDGLSGE